MVAAEVGGRKEALSTFVERLGKPENEKKRIC